METSCSGEVDRRRSSRGSRCTPPLTCTPTIVPASNGCAATAPAGKQLAPPTPSRRITGQASPRQEYPWSAVARSLDQVRRRQGALHDEASHPRQAGPGDDRPRARREVGGAGAAAARQPCQVPRGFRALHGPGGEREARPTLLRPAPSCGRWWCRWGLVQLRPQVALSRARQHRKSPRASRLSS